jgi:hypothetical protein
MGYSRKSNQIMNHDDAYNKWRAEMLAQINHEPTEIKFVFPAAWFVDGHPLKEDAEAFVKSGRAIKDEYLP